MRARSARRGQIQTDSNRLKQILPYTQTDSSRLKQIQQRLKQTQSYSVALPVPCYYRFFIMWEGPFSSPGGWEDFSEAEPSRAGSKVTNLHEASRKWGQISTTGAVVHKLTPTPASKIWRQFEHSSRGTGGRYGSGLGGALFFQLSGANLRDASRKWGQISTTGATVHKLIHTPASNMWRQCEHSSRENDVFFW